MKLNLGLNFEVMSVTKNRTSQNCQRYTHKHRFQTAVIIFQPKLTEIFPRRQGLQRLK